MKKRYFAHRLEGRPEDEWHLLEDHLKCTAEQAKSFANVFSAGEWAYLAGLWHDLGKYSEDFQKMLLASADAHIETRSCPLHRRVSARSPPVRGRGLKHLFLFLFNLSFFLFSFYL